MPRCLWSKQLLALRIYVLVILLSLPLSLSGVQSAFADGISELAADGESYSTVAEIRYLGSNYKVIKYATGDAIVVDAAGTLVLQDGQVRTIFEIHSHQEEFTKLGITKAKYEVIHQVLSNYVTYLEFISNPAAGTVIAAIGAGVGTLTLPIIGTVSGAAILGSLVVIAGRAKESLRTPLETSRKIIMSFETIETGNSSPDVYAEITRNHDRLKTELKSWQNSFVFLGNNIWGATGQALSTIGEKAQGVPLLRNVPQYRDFATKMKEVGDGMKADQQKLDEVISWMDTWDSNTVQIEANRLTLSKVTSQANRINARRNEFNQVLGPVEQRSAAIVVDMTATAAKGADTAVATSLIQEAKAKIEQAKSQSSSFLFRTGKKSLSEAEVLIGNAKRASDISLDIMTVEKTLADITAELDRKRADGADIDSVKTKVGQIESMVRTARSSLGIREIDSAKAQIDNATALAPQILAEAKSLVPKARPTVAPPVPGAPPNAPSSRDLIPSSIPTFYLIPALVALGAIAVLALRRRKK